jgi:diaminopimelate decarboxylase
MLVELNPVRTLDAGKRDFATLMEQVRTGSAAEHASPPWLETSRITGPTLLFDLDNIKERMRLLKRLAGQFSATTLVAVKSCPQSAYLQSARECLDGFDVSNLAEYSALPEPLDGMLVSITSPVMTSELHDFSRKGNSVLVTLDSLVQLEQYFTQPSRFPYVLRLQSSDLLKDAEPADAAYYPGTRFGFPVSEIGNLLRNQHIANNPPAGFHVHHGSERNQVSTYKTLIGGIRQLAQELPAPPEFINLGGGWHNLNNEEVEDVLREARRQFPLPCSILFEPGRWFAETAGYAIGTIVNQARADNAINCTLDLSGKSHLHWSQANLLVSCEANYSRGVLVKFYGPSCYESDVIGQFLVPFCNEFDRETGIAPGNKVIFTNISTYAAAWNTEFNGIAKADVMWCESQPDRATRKHY